MRHAALAISIVATFVAAIAAGAELSALLRLVLR